MLTPKGRSKRLSQDDARKIVQKWVAHFAARRQSAQAPQTGAGPKPQTDQPEEEYGEQVLSHLQALTPQAFEKFCEDLLRHIGIEDLKATGGVGDKGIDGEGYLRVGPLATTKIAYQCKRYSGPVQAHEVREFQGAIGARAEKGIFFTTGYFTNGARDAAREITSKHIELVDGERLVELLEEYKFGLEEVKTFCLDHSFLANYEVDTKKTKQPKG
jgi:restriction system protein